MINTFFNIHKDYFYHFTVTINKNNYNGFHVKHDPRLN